VHCGSLACHRQPLIFNFWLLAKRGRCHLHRRDEPSTQHFGIYHTSHPNQWESQKREKAYEWEVRFCHFPVRMTESGQFPRSLFPVTATDTQPPEQTAVTDFGHVTDPWFPPDSLNNMQNVQRLAGLSVAGAASEFFPSRLSNFDCTGTTGGFARLSKNFWRSICINQRWLEMVFARRLPSRMWSSTKLYKTGVDNSKINWIKGIQGKLFLYIFIFIWKKNVFIFIHENINYIHSKKFDLYFKFKLWGLI
jgi:hypothetical protein